MMKDLGHPVWGVEDFVLYLILNYFLINFTFLLISMMAAKPEQLTDLPWQDIIFQHIFPHLSVAELCQLCAVSKSFQRVSNEYFYACKQLDFSNYNMTDDNFQKVIYF